MSNVDNTEKCNCISFCTGYAGIELGLKKVIPHLRTVVYVEREAFACANLVAKIEKGQLDAAPVWTDVKTFPAERFRDRIHLITAGYPCQPFSVAGKRKGHKDPRHLWPAIRNHIETIRPVYCFFENVAGHLRLGFDAVVRDLDALGYSVQAGLFTAAEVGAPHKRERLFILAYPNLHPNGQNVKRDEKTQGIQGKHRQTLCRGRITGTSEQLAYPVSTRSQRGRSQRNRQRQTGLCNGEADNQTQWPARPDQQQYEWEEPRTIEPGVCCSIDGYNARVDQIRLCGNGVVPQVAELAWRTLFAQTKESEAKE